jgi:murein DD-endopeptidase MepM/ murein hydrolase activator NlpD
MLTMNIILVSERLHKARTITLGWPHFVASGVAMLGLVVLLAGALNYGILRFAAELNIPYLRDVLVSIQRQQHEKTQSYLQDNLNAMAVRLGQMQAQLLRLETLGERLAKIAGFKPQDLMFNEIPGRGGAQSSVPSQNLSLGDFTQQIDQLTRQLDDRGDKLGLLESMFTQESARKKLIPTKLPVEGAWYSSNFGWRIDPFTGQRAFHEGIDFMAEEGTPVFSAAAGVVVYAEFHPQYGNMVEIDHGNDLISRYAHASKKYVKVGDVVLRGSRIADVGRTGRATGAHLHFEVRQRGTALNPARFLQLPG